METRKEMTPAQYFERLKQLKEQNKNTAESLDKFYDAAIALMGKYKLFNQKKMIKKLMFIVDCIPKERQLLELGVDTFIYKDDIEDFINSVEGKAVKIIEMENFPRDIPEEFGDIVQKTSKIFDEYYVLFTDYNGREEKKIAKERRERDPILFGVFKKGSILNDRLYYLGDWVDEYCDLTLEKLIAKAGDNIIKNIKVPQDKQELIKECNNLIEKDDHIITTATGTYSPNITTTSSTTGTIINIINPVAQSEDNIEGENNG